MVSSLSCLILETHYWFFKVSSSFIVFSISCFRNSAYKLDCIHVFRCYQIWWYDPTELAFNSCGIQTGVDFIWEAEDADVKTTPYTLEAYQCSDSYFMDIIFHRSKNICCQIGLHKLSEPVRIYPIPSTYGTSMYGIFAYIYHKIQLITCR